MPIPISNVVQFLLSNFDNPFDVPVFVHKGVGRGYESNGNGFVTRTARYPARVRERVAVEWFNPVLDRNIPILADEIANINADAAVNATRMKIL